VAAHSAAAGALASHSAAATGERAESQEAATVAETELEKEVEIVLEIDETDIDETEIDEADIDGLHIEVGGRDEAEIEEAAEEGVGWVRVAEGVVAPNRDAEVEAGAVGWWWGEEKDPWCEAGCEWERKGVGSMLGASILGDPRKTSVAIGVWTDSSEQSAGGKSVPKAHESKRMAQSCG